MILKILLSSLFIAACTSSPSITEEERKRRPQETMESYWFSGKAELSSYSLKQARYGEVHEGHSVLVFVTEPFNTSKLVKSDYGSADDVQVLKLNQTKKFNTGVYPYSMMTSTFLPVENPEHSLKVTTSVQEWCGHVYMELLNNDTFDIDIRSYFEDETKNLSLEKTLIEDDLWSKIRINPDELPEGDLTVIPSFFYLRLKHKPAQGYSCAATLDKSENSSTYTLNYKELNRTLAISFENEFPHKITGWVEEYPGGWTDDTKIIRTEGALMNSIQSDYWNKNSVVDLELRKELGLH